MASTTLKELKYRRFDELMDEIYIDLPSFTREGMVEPGQLIKVAQRVNYELGLKINGTKETILDVEYGKAKLPSDFYILNFATLCGQYTVIESGLFNGIHTENVVTPIQNPNSIPQLTSCPCWKVTNPTDHEVSTNYIDCKGVEQILTIAANDTIQLCASSVNSAQQLTVYTDSFCYNIPKTGTFSCNLPEEDCACDIVQVDQCDVVNADPWKQNRVFTQCNNRQEVNVIEYHSNEVRRYDVFESIYMVPSKEASSFCVNTRFDSARHRGFIRDGFLHVPTLQERNEYGSVGPNGEYVNVHEYNRCAKVYICYLGSMEDADGNLLVLDHPKINEYYEWAIKERIFQNMYLNGEPNIERRLQLVQAELKSARAQALSIATMPDFYELKNTIETNRRAMYYKYLHPFSSLYANTPGWPWAINSEYI